MGGEEEVTIPVTDAVPGAVAEPAPPASPHVITLAPTAGAHSPDSLAEAKAAIAAAAAAAARSRKATGTASTDIVQATAPEKLSYKTVDAIIRSVYNYSESYGSTALDILAIYLKGQKILYTEAKTYCEQRMNYLMLPAIFISAICTVLSLVLKPYDFGPTVIASLNGFNSFLLTLVTYLKLDAKAEAHKTSSYKFDKLQSLCEFNSGKVLFFFDDDTEQVLTLLQEIETKVKEIKETNQFILPEPIRHRYKKLYSTNVFSIVKKIQNDEMILINDLKNVINEIISYSAMKQTDGVQEEMMALQNKQNKIIENIIKFRKKYHEEIDDDFEDEINENITAASRGCNPCSWLKT
jgi:hypothetical protein